ncbi:helix-turn-helix transcriptional regulator [Paenibacillus silvae]|uniref:AraC family transcriptional regulator n=1 Tax=Paenibacillus silvae TaxID=1325358 RepID=A0A2W6NFL2_9BACL|nr:AraC family transcriptional regulator [Paenibacillus silvae]PZT54752.1 AraC family transcriptional regulator [Paenibacillus silvae]
MNIDVNQLAEHFAHTPFQVKGIYKYTKTTGVPHADYTDAFPGFVFPLTGRIQFQFNEKPYILSPGKVVHGGAKMKLAKTTIHNSNWEYILVLYQTYGSELEAFSFSNQHFELSTGQSPRLYELIMQLWQVYNQPGGIPMFQTEMLFRDVLNETLLSVVNRQTSRDSLALFKEVSHYIHENYYLNHTVASLSEQYGVNRNRISYVFKQHARMGPAEYLTTYRIEMAKKMLLASDVTIQHIAQAVGMQDAFYFSRVFKRLVGCSPTAYRQRFINNPS